MEALLSVEEAQARAVAPVVRVGAERVGLRAALGRVLAETVRASGDVPPEDNSAMDGFAVRAADAGDGAELPIAGEAAAGHPWSGTLGAGQAVRIMTGAPLPAGADAVVMVEHTAVADGRVRIGRAAQSGDHVRRAGEDLRAGDEVLAAGTTVGAAELGVLAAARRAQVAVARRPIVAILSTGDELRDVGEPLEPGAIAETNSYALAALAEQAGAQVRVLPRAADDPALRAAIEDARSADLIVSTGGVSVGEHDHVKSVLASLGAALSFWRVDMKPGKPVAVAALGATPYYGLPGNPASSMVSFLLFVRPAIRTALGCTQPFDLARATALLDGPLRARGERRNFLRARLRWDENGQLRAAPMGGQGSHLLTSMVAAGGLIILPAGAHDLPAGAPVPVLLLPRAN